MDSEVSFGAWLTRRRKALDLTRGQLAHCIGCSVSALRKIEADERRPSVNMAELLANCLQVPLEDRAAFLRAARGVALVEHLGTPMPAGAARGPIPPGPAPQPPAAPHETPARPWAIGLPAWPTPLLGREAELAVLGQLLRDPACRLLTLIGPGGIGKTRLAVAAAAAQASHFPDGVFFVGLASVVSPDHLVSTVAQSIGYSFGGPADPMGQLIRYLCSRRMLLVLDNFEHLLGGVELLSRALECTEQTRLLVTSRAVLDLQGEWVFEVQGLPAPPPEQTAGLEGYSSVDLFLQGARRASLAFRASRDDMACIAHICRLAEGMPLAIELAATWVRVLACQEIAAEIERDLGFLSTSARNVPERHHSLRAVFDRSWELLDDDERRIMRDLSIFRGGFRREAAEAVAGASLASLAGLATRSLLRRSAEGRCDLHNLVRQYAANRLAECPEEMRAIRTRFSRYYLGFLGERGTALQGREQTRAVAELGQEIDNLRQAWTWAADDGELALLRRAAWPFWYYFALRNMFPEGETAFHAAIEALQGGSYAGDQAPTDDAGGVTVETLIGYLQALYALFVLAQLRVGEAQGLLRESLARLRRGSDDEALADALRINGQACWFAGAFEEGLQSYTEAYDLARKVRHAWLMGIIPTFAGIIEHDLGHYAESRRWFADGLATSRKLGDPRLIASTALLLGRTDVATGRGAEAESLLHEALELARRSGDRFIEGAAQEQLAVLRHAAGDLGEASRFFDESLALYRAVDDRSSLTRALVSAGHCALAGAKDAAAQAFFVEALQVASRAHLYPAALDALVGIASQRMRHQVDPGALAAVSLVLQHPACTYEARTQAERLWSAALPGLSPEQVAAATAAGRPDCFDTIIAQALA